MKVISKPKSGRENLTIRMYPDLRDRAKIQAIQEQRSLSDLIEEALETLLNTLEQAA
ncbi:MAG: hypothetical protein QNJ46_15975 [Leptolyngbyaceae cyanobacterium MO_188.B28]|nr:hypothetical protein [Leptolyngbyaceae cyanobacterium MO_188.B28]